MIEGRVLIKSPRCWISKITTKYPGVNCKIMSMKIPENSSYIHELFVIDGPPDRLESAVQDLKDDSNVKDVDISESKFGRTIGSLKCMCKVGKTVTSSKSFATTAIGRASGEVELTIFGNDKAMKDLLEKLEMDGADTRIAGWTSRNGSSLLSIRQELVLKVALECGYFDFPKKIKLRELAKNFGVAPASLVESLRSAEKKILSEYAKARAGLQVQSKSNGLRKL
jgi:predicted DNA binding protein